MSLAGILDRLGRVTSTGRLIPQIDGLRFVAIGTVVFFHLAGVVTYSPGRIWQVDPAETWAGRLAAQGHFGVQLFFAISGFILALPFAKQGLAGGRPVALGAYFLRRLTRLEPPYVLSLLLLFVLQLANGRELMGHAQHLLASLLYQHNLVYGRASTINLVAWSLEVEVQFYVLAPLFGLVFRIQDVNLRRGTLAAAGAALLALRAWHPTAVAPEEGRVVWLLDFLEFFWAGFVLAELYVTRRWEEAPRRAGWDLVSLVGWPLLVAVWVDGRFTPVAFPLLVLPLYAAALRGPWSSRLFSVRWIVVVGGMCYSLYLLHLPIIAGLARLTRRLITTSTYELSLALQGAILVSVALGLSALFFAAVERPCMRPDWPSRAAAWLRGLREVAPAGPPRGGDA